MGGTGRRPGALLLALLAAAPAGALLAHRAGRAQARGLNEVITVLLKMMSEFNELAQEDKDAWEDWSEQADESRADKTEYVREQDALLMQARGVISGKQEAAANLAHGIEELKDDIKDTRKSLSELTKMRAEEHDQCQANLKDLTNTIGAVTKAIEILEGHYAASGATLLAIRDRVQYGMALAGSDSTPSRELATFMQSAGPDWLAVDGSKYNSYEKQGGAGGVIGTLNDLKSTLDQNKQDMIESDNDLRRQYEETSAAKEREIRRLGVEIAAKAEAKAQAEAAVERAKATISSTTQNKADAKAYLAKLKKDSDTFSKEYRERVQMRNDEMQATQAALDALQAISAGAKEGVGSFLQTIGAPHRGCPRCRREASKLRKLASGLHSSTLAQVAMEFEQRSHGDYDASSFEPVVDLLRGLVERLEGEQSAETTHHQWCEVEKKTSAAAKDDRDHLIKELKGNIELLTVGTSQLKSEITFLTDELARVKKETERANEAREAAKETFDKAKADHEEVLHALAAAIKPLEEQYGLVQVAAGASATGRAARRAGQPFGSYEGGGSSAGSALEMLEDLQERYSKALAQLTKDETSAVATYKDLVKSNREFTKDALDSKHTKLAERRMKIEQLKSDKEELKGAFTELGELTEYLQELRPRCDDIRSSLEERSRRRQAEIAALKSCLEALSDPSGMDGP